MSCCEILEDNVLCGGLVCEFLGGSKVLIINWIRGYLRDILIKNICEFVMLELKNEF